MKLADHPTVRRIQQRSSIVEEDDQPLDADWLRRLVLDAGADDVGFVEIERPELKDQRDAILQAFPRTKTLISFVVRLNREPIRTPARSVANLEFHRTGEREKHRLGAAAPEDPFQRIAQTAACLRKMFSIVASEIEHPSQV